MTEVSVPFTGFVVQSDDVQAGRLMEVIYSPNANYGSGQTRTRKPVGGAARSFRPWETNGIGQSESQGTIGEVQVTLLRVPSIANHLRENTCASWVYIATKGTTAHNALQGSGPTVHVLRARPTPKTLARVATMLASRHFAKGTPRMHGHQQKSRTNLEHILRTVA